MQGLLLSCDAIGYSSSSVTSSFIASGLTSPGALLDAIVAAATIKV